MIVTALWYGSSSYAAPTADDAETFPSLYQAVQTFQARADFDPEYPCVDGPAMLIFRGRSIGEYPDYVIELGPRGGVRIGRG